LAAAAAAARAVMEDGGGPYPYPSPRSSTLLPGQTYPDPTPVKSAGTMQAISSLQEVLIPTAIAVPMLESPAVDRKIKPGKYCPQIQQARNKNLVKGAIFSYVLVFRI